MGLSSHAGLRRKESDNRSENFRPGMGYSTPPLRRQGTKLAQSHLSRQRAAAHVACTSPKLEDRLQSDGQEDDGAGLPREVRELIREHIHSLEQLDLLLVLHEQPGQALGVSEAAAALGSTDALARATMTHLCRQGLSTVSADSTARYDPKDALLHKRVMALAASYAQSRTEVLTFISACALDRVRDAQGRAFAHAYLGHRSKKE